MSFLPLRDIPGYPALIVRPPLTRRVSWRRWRDETGKDRPCGMATCDCYDDWKSPFHAGCFPQTPHRRTRNQNMQSARSSGCFCKRRLGQRPHGNRHDARQCNEQADHDANRRFHQCDELQSILVDNAWRGRRADLGISSALSEFLGCCRGANRHIRLAAFGLNSVALWIGFGTILNPYWLSCSGLILPETDSSSGMIFQRLAGIKITRHSGFCRISLRALWTYKHFVQGNLTLELPSLRQQGITLFSLRESLAFSRRSSAALSRRFLSTIHVP